jgi:molybdate transport system ATP-binding protein
MESGAAIAQGEVAKMSLDPHLRSLIGPDQVGAIIDGVVLGFDAASGLTKVRVGHGDLYVQVKDLAVGTPLRVQLLARDVIVSTQIPERLSVRNCLAGLVTGIQDDDLGSDLVTIDIGGALIVARITKAATRDLSLTPQMNTWALVKTVSLRGHSFAVSTPAATSAASPDA